VSHILDRCPRTPLDRGPAAVCCGGARWFIGLIGSPPASLQGFPQTSEDGGRTRDD